MVTGGAGFIGSHLVDSLLERDCEVVVVDNLNTGKRENVNAGARFYKMDIREEDIRGVLQRERPKAVFHLAAQVDVGFSLAEPALDADINIVGTINLLESCCRCGVKKIVYASSAAVYGNPRYLPVDEKHPLVPESGYGVSKQVVESYLELYRRLYGVNYIVLRYANVYGPRQDAAGEGGVVAIFTDRLLRGEAPEIFGDGEQTRDFIYVKDVTAANLAALDFLWKGNSYSGKVNSHGGVFNISTGERVSVNVLYRLIRKFTGSRAEARYCPPRPGDIRHSCLENRLAREILGWSPRYVLKKGLLETVQKWQES